MSLPSPDPSHQLVIVAGEQSDGVTYQLHPVSRERIKRSFPDAHMPRSLFVGTDTQRDYAELHGGTWRQVGLLLTGLSVERLATLGDCVIYFPTTGAAHVIPTSEAEIDAA